MREKEYLTIKSAAERRGVSRGTIYRWIAIGLLRGHRVETVVSEYVGVDPSELDQVQPRRRGRPKRQYSRVTSGEQG